MKNAFRHEIFLILVCFLLGKTVLLYAQKNDTLQPSVRFITDRLENLTRLSDRQQDYSDLTGDYLYYARHPLNINDPEQMKKLQALHLLDEMQLTSVENYIHQYGIIYSVYELRYLPGFNANSIRRILPFIKTGPVRKSSFFSWKNIFRYGNHRLIMRYGQILETEQGYRIPADSSFLKPGSVFLGNPQNLYMRYGFRSDDRLRFGFTAQKDAGEVFLAKHLGDSVKKMLGRQQPVFPDFFSVFVYVTHLGIVKKIVVGDYHLEFGQGICLWSGLTFGKSAEATDLRYFGRGIRPNTSANENRFFRGGAVTLGIKNVSLTLFYSHNKVDGTVFFTSGKKEEISGMPETGYHRTIRELLNRKRLPITVYGAHAGYAENRWKVGFTWYRTQFGFPLEPDSQLYRVGYFRGKQMTNASINGAVNLNRFSFFGELAANPGNSFAGMAGVNAYPSDRLALLVMYRRFSPGYHVLYAAPFMESDRVSNEQGIYFGLKMLLSARLTFSAYADYFRFPWLKFHVNAPSVGKAFLAQLDVQTGTNLSMYFRVRYGQRQENNSEPDGYHTGLVNKSLSDFRYALTYSPSVSLLLKTRIEYVRYEKAQESQTGYLVYQDVIYRFRQFPFTINFRYALFDTDGWNSRIYAYESDVLYAFSIPPYYDKGRRVYLLLHYRMKKHFDFWLRTARTVFFNKTKISSGPETIFGNHKTSVKFQVLVKF